jgi:hypothetical protein
MINGFIRTYGVAPAEKMTAALGKTHRCLLGVLVGAAISGIAPLHHP